MYDAAAINIPRIIHVIWIGDERKRPDHNIATWRDNHPAWEFRLWSNAELERVPWRSKRQIGIYRDSGHWEGVADLMRYEILFEHGGVYVDADSTSLRPLDSWLLAPRMFAVWESEQHRPGLVANTFIGSVPQHPALGAIIRATSRMNKPTWRRTWEIEKWSGLRPRFRYALSPPPWQMVGPVFFTKMISPFCPQDVTILPSILFLPRHFEDTQERQSSCTYARPDWGTTHLHGGPVATEPKVRLAGN
jgi:inositol phosphorylceramide mannosyltransferase catalytic subunit